MICLLLWLQLESMYTGADNGVPTRHGGSAPAYMKSPLLQVRLPLRAPFVDESSVAIALLHACVSACV
jgi:hypothetical protein